MLILCYQEVFEEHPRLSIRSDLSNTHIAVASPEVLIHFSDNYDYKDIYEDYVRNEAQNHDLGWRFFTHVLVSEFAARAVCPWTYAALTADVLARRSYPYTPDTGLVHNTPYTLARSGLYKAKSVSMARTAVVQGRTMVGPDSRLEEGSRVVRSCLGANVQVASGATITDSFLWDGVQVGEGATLSTCIVAQGAVVGKGATVERGCMLGAGTVVAPGVTVPAFTRLTCEPVHSDAFSSDDDWGSDGGSMGDGEDDTAGGGGGGTSEEESATEVAASTADLTSKVIGSEGGNGRVWPAPTEVMEDEEDSIEMEEDQLLGVDASTPALVTASVVATLGAKLQQLQELRAAHTSDKGTKAMWNMYDTLTRAEESLDEIEGETELKMALIKAFSIAVRRERVWGALGASELQEAKNLLWDADVDAALQDDEAEEVRIVHARTVL